MTIFGEILSTILDFSPIGNIKCGLEALSGYNSVTFEKLDDFDRAMCFVGMIPYVGNIVKKFAKTGKAMKRIKFVSKVAGGAGVLNDLKGIKKL